jgi:hypothetical protein
MGYLVGMLSMWLIMKNQVKEYDKLLKELGDGLADIKQHLGYVKS